MDSMKSTIKNEEAQNNTFNCNVGKDDFMDLAPSINANYVNNLYTTVRM